MDTLLFLKIEEEQPNDASSVHKQTEKLVKNFLQNIKKEPKKEKSSDNN